MRFWRILLPAARRQAAVQRNEQVWRAVPRKIPFSARVQWASLGYPLTHLITRRASGLTKAGGPQVIKFCDSKMDHAQPLFEPFIELKTVQVLHWEI